MIGVQQTILLFQSDPTVGFDYYSGQRSKELLISQIQPALSKQANCRLQCLQHLDRVPEGME
jgi:hypothetical protein